MTTIAPLQLPLFDMLVICSGCSRLQLRKDRWSKDPVRRADYPETDFSHGLCAPCLARLYPQFRDAAPRGPAVRRRAPAKRPSAGPADALPLLRD